MADGVILATEEGADSATLSGATVAFGVVAAAESGPDTAELVGSTPVQLAAKGSIEVTADLAGYIANATLRIEKTYTPGAPGIPGDPGQPWIPAYTSTETSYGCYDVPVYEAVPVQRVSYTGPPDFSAHYYTDYILVVVGFRTECGYITRTTHHPEQPYIAPTPGTPDIPPDFHLGWNDGARAGPYAGNLDFVFKAHSGVVGTVVGLTPPGRDAGYGYLEIDYGLHFSGGYVRVLEGGAVRTGFFPYTLDDVFTIQRRGKFITYRINSEVMFETTMPAADLAGPLTVDLSMYSGADAIWDAQITETPLDGYGAGDAELPPLRAFGADSLLNYGDADLPALEATGSGHGWNVGNAELPPLHALGGDHHVGQAADQMLPALESYGESGYMAPGIPNYGDAFLPALIGGGLILVGGIGVGNAELPPLHALGGDHHFGQAPDQELPALEAVGYQFVHVDGVVLADGPEMSVEASGSILTPNSVDAGGPEMSVESWGQSVVEAGGPGMSVEAEGFVHNVGRVDAGGPGMSVEAEGFIALAGYVDAGGPGMAVEAWGQNVVDAGGPGMAVEAEGFVHNVGRVDAGGPGMSVEAEGVIALAGYVDVGGPGMWVEAAGPDAGAIAEAGWPMMYVVASGDIGGAPLPVTYAVNLRASETTRYEGFRFDRILRLGGRCYGLNPDGLYLLEGGTDAGAAINGFVQPHPNDFGTQHHKRTPYLYLGTDDPAEVTAYVDGVTVGTFGGYHGARRVNLPRGPRGRYWAYRVANVAGGDLRLDGYEPQIDVLMRKV